MPASRLHQRISAKKANFYGHLICQCEFMPLTPVIEETAETLAPRKSRQRYVHLSDFVYEKVLGMIHEGAFGPSGRLPTEPVLAQVLKVSRPVLREALARLRIDGLVESRHGAGTFVLNPAGLASVGPLVEQAEVVTTVPQLLRCFEFRLPLEREAAGLAAGRSHPESIAAIREALVAMEHPRHANATNRDLDFQFHLAVANASMNEFFPHAMLSMEKAISSSIEVNRTLSVAHTRDRHLQVHAEHRAIFEAIVAGDSEAARLAMHKHINNARLHLFDTSADDGA